jgi:hypothetical protein
MEMGIIWKLLSTPVKLVNAPLRALEDLFEYDGKTKEDDRIISKPLQVLADELKKIDE